MTGSTVSHYRVLEKLGGGGMGVVYKAEDTKLGRQVALKFLPESVSQDAHALERFQREARAASALNHPNICTIYEIDEHEGKPFIAMELLEGQTLKRRLADRPFIPEEILELAVQIADALDAAHSKGIVHRDIKPTNIFITQKGQAKILDFGLATQAKEGGPLKGLSADDQETASSAQLTRSGEAVGTLIYMSPEQLQGEPLDAGTDIYSFGAVLYEMATGQLAFFRNASAAANRFIEVPAELERIIHRAMEQDRRHRYASAADMLSDLQRMKRKLESGQVAIRRPRRKAIDSLAVLPFENTSGDPDKEYLSEGITEGIINRLTELPKLRVMAHSTVNRFGGQPVDAQAAGRVLGVRAVLAGRVSQQGDRLMIRAELVDIADGARLWGEEYDRPAADLALIPQEISSVISERLRMRLSGEEKKRLTKRPTENPEAYRLYLQGRYHWNKRTTEGLEKSIEYFVQAADLDPHYALAFAGLADCYNMMGWYRALPPRQSFARGKMAARRALDIDGALVEAQTSLAWAVAEYEWDWEAAEKEFRRAEQLNPNYAPCYHFQSVFLLALGRTEEAAVAGEKAVELDPLSLIFSSARMFVLSFEGRDEEALERHHRILEMDPDYFPAHLLIGRVYERLGRFEEGIAALQHAVRINDSTWAVAELARLCAVAGKHGEARVLLERLSQEKRYVSPYDLALVHEGLKEREQALDCLEKAFTDRSAWLTMIAVEPRLENLRGEPRFQDIVRRMAFPKSSPK